MPIAIAEPYFEHSARLAAFLRIHVSSHAGERAYNQTPQSSDGIHAGAGGIPLHRRNRGRVLDVHIPGQSGDRQLDGVARQLGCASRQMRVLRTRALKPGPVCGRTLMAGSTNGVSIAGSPNVEIRHLLRMSYNGFDRSRRVLVTGGTGTLGRHVVPRLREAGCDVRVLSRRPHETAGRAVLIT